MNYLNINTVLKYFTEARTEIYVDKSLLIQIVNTKINTKSKYICITRPRRFGKTINANMLAAYYTKNMDAHKQFQDLKISKCATYHEHLNKHNVIYIDFSNKPQFCSDFNTYILNIYNKLMEDILEAYPQLKGKSFSSLSDILTASNDSFIIVMDEWDSVFYEDFMSEKDKVAFLKFLKSILKDQTYIELVYMTGVLPIAKYSSGSELNVFDEFNFMNDNVFDAFFGFSEEEVKELCEHHHGVDYKDLKYWYDGYHLSNGKSLFNPRSVVKALTRKCCLNYWTETGPMNEIANCIEHNVDAVREDIVKLVSGIPIQVKLMGYSAADLELNTRDEILSAMVVYGFLSYYDSYLSIPNHELMEKFELVLSRESMKEVRDIVDQSKEIVQATLDGNEQLVASLLEKVHDNEIPFLQYNDENSLSCVITLCYLYARIDYDIIREAKTGKGYCDYLFIPRRLGKPAIILELEMNASAQIALQQMIEKDYIQKVKHVKECIYVGINYDKKTKKHTCLINKVTNA